MEETVSQGYEGVKSEKKTQERKVCNNDFFFIALIVDHSRSQGDYN